MLINLSSKKCLQAHFLFTSSVFINPNFPRFQSSLWECTYKRNSVSYTNGVCAVSVFPNRVWEQVENYGLSGEKIFALQT